MEVWDEKICKLDENRHQGGRPLMVARVTGEGLMVDQNEVAVVWVTREAQAKADRRPWTVAGTVARVTRRLCLLSVHPSQSLLPPPHPIPPRMQL